MSEDDPNRWKEFDRRLDAARRALDQGKDAPLARSDAPMGGFALAWRAGIELLAGILVGTGLGWAIDRALGTRPWGMIVLFFLGTAAGMLNVWRAVTGTGRAVGFKAPPRAARQDRDDED